MVFTVEFCYGMFVFWYYLKARFVVIASVILLACFMVLECVMVLSCVMVVTRVTQHQGHNPL